MFSVGNVVRVTVETDTDANSVGQIGTIEEYNAPFYYVRLPIEYTHDGDIAESEDPFVWYLRDDEIELVTE